MAPDWALLPVSVREQVRRTVLHELAHHFGIDHDAMPEWVR
jgi:predicted Zn-dependent protease with MMP-like domain